MRAVVFPRLGHLSDGSLADVPPPSPGPDDVLVGVAAVPVNYVDLVTIAGRYQFSPPLPHIPGKGPAGTVLAVGADVDGVGVGDRVLAMAERGGYAELVCAPSRDVYRLPDGLSFPDAAALSLAADTAWMALRQRARLRPGERVLVLGASGAVGAAAIQLAGAMGAAQVLAGTRSVRLGHEMSDCPIVDLSGSDLRNSIRSRVADLTGGAGVDVVIDTIGGDAFDGALRALSWQGRLVVIGFAAGRIPTVAANYLLVKNIEVSGLQISDYRKRCPDLVRAGFGEIFAWCEQGVIHPAPARIFPLGQWRDALELLEQGAPGERVILLPQ